MSYFLFFFYKIGGGQNRSWGKVGLVPVEEEK
jgi:hypothetical protein